MTAAWPTSTVNLGVVRTSYREEPESYEDRNKPEVGPPLVRSVSSLVTVPTSFEGRYTAAEWTALYAFWLTTCLRGTLPFTRAHPVTGTSTLYLFEAPPKLIGKGATLYHVALSLRAMP